MLEGGSPLRIEARARTLENHLHRITSRQIAGLRVSVEPLSKLIGNHQTNLAPHLLTLPRKQRLHKASQPEDAAAADHAPLQLQTSTATSSAAALRLTNPALGQAPEPVAVACECGALTLVWQFKKLKTS